MEIIKKLSIQAFFSAITHQMNQCDNRALFLPTYLHIGPLNLIKLVECVDGKIYKNGILSNWNDFETGNFTIETQNYIDEVFESEIIQGPLLVITDELLKQELCIEVSNRDYLPLFINTYYPQIFEEDFIQPLDIIFYALNDKKIFITDHDGRIFKLSF